MATAQIARKHSRFVSHSPIYYGWIVWIVATIGLIATSPGQSYTVSLFFDFFIEDFGLSRTAVSSLYGLGTFTASLGLTWIGLQIDRFGNRKVGVLIGISFSAAVILFSFVAGPLTLLIGFIALRGFGQGSLSLVNTTVVAEWFQRLRGRMMSLSIVALALFQSQYVPWLQRQLEVRDWREMWVFLGVIVAVIVIPMTWILMRNKPEDYGLLPDGDHTAPTDQELEAEAANSWTLRQAMTTPIFWAFVVARFIPPAWGTGLVIHQLSIFEQVGHSGRVAAETYGSVTILMAASSLLFGVLVDKLRPAYVLMMQLSALSAALIFANIMETHILLMLYALSFGMMMGAGGVFDGAVWANLFGRRYQASIRGFVTTTMVAGTALGPVLFGLSYDYLDGYQPIFLVGIAISIMAGTFALIAKPPQKRMA